MDSLHSPKLKKKFGQHLMISEEILENIVGYVHIDRSTQVVEIGPGTGLLTDHLIPKFDSLTCIEIDNEMVAYLQNKYRSVPAVKIVTGDILQMNIEELTENRPYIVVANLPYSSGARIVRHFLESSRKPGYMIVTLQKEVAHNLAALKGKQNLLSIAVGIHATVEILQNIGPEHFSPPPKVDSSIVRLVTRENPLVPMDEIDRLFEFARAGFSAKRKQLINSLPNQLGLSSKFITELLISSDIDPKRRPETLTVLEWHNLTKNYGGNHDC
tara:strand:+ start:52 stop:864 length:813 start_codon:yes stop_codon:yes gene_type:complete